MKKIIILSMVIIIISIGVLLPTSTAIVFYDKQTDEVIAYHPAEKEETFKIIFVHSIHLTDVTEKYEIMDNGKIKQYEMIFSQFGIGMPSEVEEEEEIYYEDGFYHLTNMNNIFDSLHIRNGKTVSEHRFVWKDSREHQVYLNEFMDPGAFFELKVKKLSLIDKWKEVKVDG